MLTIGSCSQPTGPVSPHSCVERGRSGERAERRNRVETGKGSSAGALCADTESFTVVPANLTLTSLGKAAKTAVHPGGQEGRAV